MARRFRGETQKKKDRAGTKGRRKIRRLLRQRRIRGSQIPDISRLGRTVMKRKEQ